MIVAIHAPHVAVMAVGLIVAAVGPARMLPMEIQDDAGCARAYSGAVASDVLGLPFDAFDQSSDTGWRPLARDGCYLAAAQLLDDYVEEGAEAQENLQILRFHAGQMFAFAEDYPHAIERIEQCYWPRELIESLAADDPEISRALHGWNVYVDATLSFLRRDKESLQTYRDELAALVSDGIPGTDTNLRVVDRLLARFEASYADAYNASG